MTSSFTPLLINDIRLQWRNGIYFAYAFVLAAYISVLVFLGQYLPSWVVGLIIYTDPAVLGFFFLGALMMLENADGTRTALATTPMSAADYFWAKTISLTAISLLAAIILGLFIHSHINWLMYLPVILLVSLSFTAISFPIALHFKTATSYLMGAAAILTPIILPMFIALLDPFPQWTMIFPTTAQFRLLLISLGISQAGILETTILWTINILTGGLCIWYGNKSLKAEFGQK